MGVALDHVFQSGIIRYFEFEKSETTSSRMSVTYAQIRPQNLRAQNNELFRPHKPLFLSKCPPFLPFSVNSTLKPGLRLSWLAMLKWKYMTEKKREGHWPLGGHRTSEPQRTEQKICDMC